MGRGAVETEWGWFVGVATATLPYLCGIPLDEFYVSRELCARAFREGRPKVREMFGPGVTLPAVSCPPLSYGHVACLGAKVLFPRDSEPAVRPICQNLEDAIAVLETRVEFEENELLKHYVAIYQHLKREFLEEEVKFGGFGWEGPITSAVLVRGKGFCVDLHTRPERAKVFLELLTESIVSFAHFTRRINSEPEISQDCAGLADDFSSLIHPSMWKEFVVPYWNRYYAGLTSGKRNLHCENLSPEHLGYLASAGVSHYDPSVSAKLSPKIIRERIKIPFTWRLPSFELMNMSVGEVKGWVRRAMEDGAPHVHLYIERSLCEGDNPKKVLAFIEAAKDVAGTSMADGED